MTTTSTTTPTPPSSLAALPDDTIRQALIGQLQYSKPPDLDSRPHPAQVEWVRSAERRLWGASIVMNERLGYKPRIPDQMLAEGDALEHAWLALYYVIAGVKKQWPYEVAWAEIDGRNERRRAIYHEVMAKLGLPPAY